MTAFWKTESSLSTHKSHSGSGQTNGCFLRFSSLPAAVTAERSGAFGASFDSRNRARTATRLLKRLTEPLSQPVSL